MARITANSVRLHVQRLSPPQASGREPVVVFVHGLVVDNLSSFYCPLALPLARAGCEVVLYDLRGHGRSERTPTGYDTATATADLLALLAALGLGDRPVHLVGNSYGGTLALHAALAAPGRVAGLVLLEPPLSGWLEGMLDTLSVAALSLEGSRMPAELAELRLRKAARLTATADALLNGTTLIDDIASAPQLGPLDYASLDCPVLVICGEQSWLVAGARELVRRAPRAGLRLVPGRGHDVLDDTTGAVRRAVLQELSAEAVVR